LTLAGATAAACATGALALAAAFAALGCAATLTGVSGCALAEQACCW